MTNPKSRIFAAVAGALSMGAAVAWAAEPTAQDLKIQELEQKVAALETKAAANSQDLAATIDKVLRDAEQRSQLLATNGDAGAGYDNGFFIRSGPFLLRPGAQFQFRNVTDYRTNTPGDKSDETEQGFEVRRMKFELAGTVLTKDLEYFFQWDAGSGSMVLQDAWAKYMFADEMGIRAGQFKDPVNHEELTSSKRQLAVDRSLLNEEIGGGFLDRTQGVTFIYGGYSQNNPINAEVGYHDGFNQDNTNYDRNGVDFGFAGRVEFKAMGDWKAYRDFTAMGNKDSLLVFGIAGDWSQAGNDDALHGTIDAQFETNSGLGIYGALLIQDFELEGGDDQTNWGGLIQAGYMLNPAWEIFGRWDFIDYDGDVASAGGEDFFNELTIGVNYYLGQDGSAGHRAKITVDLNWLPDGAPSSQTGIGYLGDSGGDDEVSLRAQFQLLI